MCQVHGSLRIIIGAGVRGTFVEGHDDICANDPLSVHGVFRGKQMPGAIDVGAKSHAFLPDLPGFRQGKNLVSTRSEEHTSELQSLMRTSYAVFCLKKKKNNELSKHSKSS